MRNHLISGQYVADGIHVMVTVGDDDESSNLAAELTRQVIRWPSRCDVHVSISVGETIKATHYFETREVNTVFGSDDVMDLIERLLECNRC